MAINLITSGAFAPSCSLLLCCFQIAGRFYDGLIFTGVFLIYLSFTQ